MTDKTDVTTTTAPERIWLQVDTGYCGDDRSEPFPTDFDGVTWHSEEIGGLEVEYVRADELARLRAEVARLEAEKAEAVKDAERYRWLRDTGDVTWTPFSRRTGFSAGMADTAIDAAMRGDREDG